MWDGILLAVLMCGCGTWRNEGDLSWIEAVDMSFLRTEKVIVIEWCDDWCGRTDLGND